MKLYKNDWLKIDKFMDIMQLFKIPSFIKIMLYKFGMIGLNSELRLGYCKERWITACSGCEKIWTCITEAKTAEFHAFETSHVLFYLFYNTNKLGFSLRRIVTSV